MYVWNDRDIKFRTTKYQTHKQTTHNISQSESVSDGHLGLPNVVQRLRITFSSDCAFCDKSTNIGTHVVLHI